VDASEAVKSLTKSSKRGPGQSDRSPALLPQNQRHGSRGSEKDEKQTDPPKDAAQMEIEYLERKIGLAQKDGMGVLKRELEADNLGEQC
jgi:hypothetical protein